MTSTGCDHVCVNSIGCLKWFSDEKITRDFLHNLKDIIVVSNCAKFHPKILKFLFYTAAIKMTELGRMSRGDVMMS